MQRNAGSSFESSRYAAVLIVFKNFTQKQILKGGEQMRSCKKNKEAMLPFKILLHRVLYAGVCICFALLICASCALFEICLIGGRTWAIMQGAASEDDKIRIYIDQGHNPLPYHNNGA